MKFVSSAVPLLTIALLLFGCRTDGTVTIMHPNKPIVITSKDCSVSLPQTVFIDDSKIPMSVGKGVTLDQIHGEVYIGEPISVTLNKRLKCLAEESKGKVENIRTIRIENLEIGYKNKIVMWESQARLNISTKYSDGSARSFSTTKTKGSTSFNIYGTMVALYSLCIDEYLSSLK